MEYISVLLYAPKYLHKLQTILHIQPKPEYRIPSAVANAVDSVMQAVRHKYKTIPDTVLDGLTSPNSPLRVLVRIRSVRYARYGVCPTYVPFAEFSDAQKHWKYSWVIVTDSREDVEGVIELATPDVKHLFPDVPQIEYREIKAIPNMNLTRGLYSSIKPVLTGPQSASGLTPPTWVSALEVRMARAYPICDQAGNLTPEGAVVFEKVVVPYFVGEVDDHQNIIDLNWADVPPDIEIFYDDTSPTTVLRNLRKYSTRKGKNWTFNRNILLRKVVHHADNFYPLSRRSVDIVMHILKPKEWFDLSDMDGIEYVANKFVLGRFSVHDHGFLEFEDKLWRFWRKIEFPDCYVDWDVGLIESAAAIVEEGLDKVLLFMTGEETARLSMHLAVTSGIHNHRIINGMTESRNMIVLVRSRSQLALVASLSGVGLRGFLGSHSEMPCLGIVAPKGSGKSTVMKIIRAMSDKYVFHDSDDFGMWLTRQWLDGKRYTGRLKDTTIIDELVYDLDHGISFHEHVALKILAKYPVKKEQRTVLQTVLTAVTPAFADYVNELETPPGKVCIIFCHSSYEMMNVIGMMPLAAIYPPFNTTEIIRSRVRLGRSPEFVEAELLLEQEYTASLGGLPFMPWSHLLQSLHIPPIRIDAVLGYFDPAP